MLDNKPHFQSRTDSYALSGLTHLQVFLEDTQNKNVTNFECNSTQLKNDCWLYRDIRWMRLKQDLSSGFTYIQSGIVDNIFSFPDYSGSSKFKGQSTK